MGDYKNHGHDRCAVGSVEWHFHNYAAHDPETGEDDGPDGAYHHCVGKKDNPYRIEHLDDGGHAIDTEYARGHGVNVKPVWFRFTEEVEGQDGLWVLESGEKIPVADVPKKFKGEMRPVSKPYPNQHAARMREPDDFDDGSLRTLKRNLPDGVSMIVGRLKEGKPDRDQTAQAYRFDVDDWTEAEAREWLEEQGHEPIAFEPAEKEKADDDAGDDEEASATETWGGLSIAVRDRMRMQALRKLDDEELLATHTEIHDLWKGREQGAANEGRYVNAHLEVLTELKEREIEHPDAPEGTESLDERSADIAEMKSSPSFKTVADLWDGWGRAAVADAGEVFISPIDHHCAHSETFRARDRAELDASARWLMESPDAGKMAGIRVAKSTGEQAVIPAHHEEEKTAGKDRSQESAPPASPTDVALREGEPEREGVRHFESKLKAENSWLGERRADGSRLLRAAVYKPYDIDTYGEWTDPTGCLEASIFFALSGMQLNDEHDRRCSHCEYVVPVGKEYPPGAEIVKCPKCSAAWEPTQIDRTEAVVVHNDWTDVTLEITDLYGKEQVIPKGSWVISVLCRGKMLERVESGEITGFSFQGLARSEDVV